MRKREVENLKRELGNAESVAAQERTIRGVYADDISALLLILDKTWDDLPELREKAEAIRYVRKHEKMKETAYGNE